jgi:hypothetical protein
METLFHSYLNCKVKFKIAKNYQFNYKTAWILVDFIVETGVLPENVNLIEILYDMLPKEQIQSLKPSVQVKVEKIASFLTQNSFKVDSPKNSTQVLYLFLHVKHNSYSKFCIKYSHVL